MHAAALANRPAAGQPGRVFIDTNNPSTGIYRDTGTAWIQIASTSSPEVDTLQTVTDRGNTTDNTLILTYDSLFNGSNQIEFFDVGTTAVRYGINKVGTGNKLVLQGNSPLSTFDMGLMIDAPNDTIKTYFGSNFDEIGLKLDFVNLTFSFGNNYGADGSLIIDANNQESYLYNRIVLLGSTNNGIYFSINDFNSIITTQYGGNDIGLKLDFANDVYTFGTQTSQLYIENGNGLVDINSQYNINFNLFPSPGNNVSLKLDGINNIIYSNYQGNDIGLKLDFQNDKYTLGSTTEYIGIDPTNNTLIAGANLLSGSAGGASGQHLKININGTNYKIELRNP
jgi:hypothetical protein